MKRTARQSQGPRKHRASRPARQSRTDRSIKSSQKNRFFEVSARARTSGENLFVVLLVMAPSSQEFGPPTNTGRFNPRFSYRAENVVATLERVCAKLGIPKTIRVDQGSEFVSRDLDLWAYAKGVTLDFSRPGKPTDNPFIEALNGRFRSECLNTHWFLTLADAAEKMEAWVKYYNEDQPGPSAASHRSYCKIPAEHPACRRDRRPETPACGDPANGLRSRNSGFSLRPEEKWVSGQRPQI